MNFFFFYIKVFFIYFLFYFFFLIDFYFLFNNKSPNSSMAERKTENLEVISSILILDILFNWLKMHKLSIFFYDKLSFMDFLTKRLLLEIKHNKESSMLNKHILSTMFLYNQVNSSKSYFCIS